MKNELAMTDTELANRVKSIYELKTPREIIAVLNSCLLTTMQHFVLACHAVRALIELGVDEEDLRNYARGFVNDAKLVAYGQVVPELWWALQGQHTLFGQAKRLPIPEQKRIANDEPIKVMCPGGDHRMVPPSMMSTSEIKQVFHEGEIRSEGEQIGYLRELALRRESEQIIDDVNSVTVSRKKNGIVVTSPTFISARDMANYLAELSSKTR